MSAEQRWLTKEIEREPNLNEKLRLLRLSMNFNAARAAIQNEFFDRTAKADAASTREEGSDG